MSGGVLEILLVNAEGLKQSKILGSSTQYVVIECGSGTAASKIVRGENGKAWWNEKFSFNLSSSDMKSLSRIRLRVMAKDKFVEDYSIGEATILLMDILEEANRKGSIDIKPMAYNIVLEDKTYKGEIKVGLKFFSQAKEVRTVVNRGCSLSVKQSGDPNSKQTQSLYKSILNFALQRIVWPRFSFFFIRMSPKASAERKKDE